MYLIIQLRGRRVFFNHGVTEDTEFLNSSWQIHIIPTSEFPFPISDNFFTKKNYPLTYTRQLYIMT